MEKWLTLAGLLVIVGLSLFALTACSGAFNSNGNLVENVTTVSNDFNSISIYTDTADISILPSEDEACKVVSNDLKKIEYSVKIEDSTLKICVRDTRMWFEKIFNWHTATLTLYLPENEYGTLTINEDTGDIEVNHSFTFTGIGITLSTGDINLANVNAKENVSVKVSTGDVFIDTLSCADFISEGSTGDIEVHGLTASGNVEIERSTGNVNIKNATIGGNLDTETGTGKNNATDIVCNGNFEHEVSTGVAILTNITCCDFSTEGNTGDLTMTSVIASGKFEIERSTGDVKLNGCDALEIYIQTGTGDVTGTLLTSKIFVTNSSTGKIRVPESVTGGKCKITTTTGDIIITVE